jgi:hypothetical protein
MNKELNTLHMLLIMHTWTEMPSHETYLIYKLIKQDMGMFLIMKTTCMHTNVQILGLQIGVYCTFIFILINIIKHEFEKSENTNGEF